MTDLATTTTTTPAVVAPGWRSSEFWLKLLAILLGSLYASGAIPTTGTAAQVAAIVSAMLGAFGYAVVRSQLKATALRAGPAANDNATSTTVAVRTAQAGFARHGLVTLLAAGALAGALMLHASCGAVQKGAPAFAACEATVISKVAVAIAANLPTLEADLASLGAQFGVGTVVCAIDAVKAVEASGSGSAVKLETQAGLSRARQWAATHRTAQ